MDEALYVQGIGGDNIPAQVRVTSTSEALNSLFDITPNHLVTGSITERGVCAADELELLKLFPKLRMSLLSWIPEALNRDTILNHQAVILCFGCHSNGLARITIN